ncbi:hypothetical protein [Proteus phage 10]|nr:hypothetical protein [Proteus phage 10]
MGEAVKDTSRKMSMVLYTDGGCKPSRGMGGWGVHGYTYPVDDSEDKRKKKKPAKDVPSTTGYIQKNDTDLATREVVRPEMYYDAFGGFPGEVTNNIAELTSTINGIKLAIEENVNSLQVWSDSKYVGDGLTKYLNKWIKNNWVKSDGGEVANKELWVELNKTLQDAKSNGLDFRIDWVKGHDGDYGNTMADYMATRGVILSRQGDSKPYITKTPASDYEKYTTDKPKFISHSRWYFNLNEDNALIGKNEHGFYEYYFGHPSKTDSDQVYLGQALADTAYSVVWLKEPEPCLDLIHARTAQIAENAFGNLFIGRLDNIYNRFNHKEIMDYGGQLLTRAGPRDNDIINCTNSLIVRESNPPRISYRAVENLKMLNEFLYKCIKGETSNLVTFIDITDKIYDEVTDKKGKVKLELNKKIKQTTRVLKVKANCAFIGKDVDVDVTCTFGLDIPIRNTLNGLTASNPKVYLFMVKESDIAFRYGTIVTSDDGYSIMANVYANLRILSKGDLEKAEASKKAK